jgi:beta-mannosidase
MKTFGAAIPGAAVAVPWLILVVCGFAAGADKHGKEIMDMNQGWVFRKLGESAWHPASVPGCVHTDLLENRLIEDPFYRDNEKKLQWIGRTDWEYQKTFTVGPDLLRRGHVELVCEGLDTYADVILNGARILAADNMFRQWRAECLENLKEGENNLRIVFRSPILEILPRMANRPYQLPAMNDLGEKTSPYTRKAPYHYGWDWGPRFVTCGIWKSVNFDVWDNVRIDNVRWIASRVDEGMAEGQIVGEILADREEDAVLVVSELKGGFGDRKIRIHLMPGSNRLSIPLAVARPCCGGRTDTAIPISTPSLSGC